MRALIGVLLASLVLAGGAAAHTGGGYDPRQVGSCGYWNPWQTVYVPGPYNLSCNGFSGYWDEIYDGTSVVRRYAVAN